MVLKDDGLGELVDELDETGLAPFGGESQSESVAAEPADGSAAARPGAEPVRGR